MDTEHDSNTPSINTFDLMYSLEFRAVYFSVFEVLAVRWVFDDSNSMVSDGTFDEWFSGVQSDKFHLL